MHNLAKCVGIGAVAFGFGLLLAFFLPKSALIVSEALVIIIAGAAFVIC